MNERGFRVLLFSLSLVFTTTTSSSSLSASALQQITMDSSLVQSIGRQLMEEKLESSEKKVLVSMVKLTQKLQKKGEKGNWKEFLNVHDKQLGKSMSDPAKRSAEDLVAFLKTFKNEEDCKLFGNILRCHSNLKNAVEQYSQISEKEESVEKIQKLVRLTLQHPQYLSEYSFPSHDEGWVVTKLPEPSIAKKLDKMIAVDCEMVLCEDGSEAVVQVCAVDQNMEVKLNERVKPDKVIADYRTEITGILAKDLEGVACSLTDVQRSMRKLMRNGTVLVGHGLCHDLQVLKLDHARVIDTSYIFKYMDGPTRRRPSLTDLCKSVLGYELRKKGAPHNCLDDAKTAMRLVLAKLEHGYDNGVSQSSCKTEADLAQLFLHKIPVGVPKESLHKIFPKHFAFELKPSTKAPRNYYSVTLVFKDLHKAHEAFESIESGVEEDSYGRPQKFVTFEVNAGLSASLYVRKIVPDLAVDQIDSSKKRPLEDENTNEAKKQKTELDQYIKEIASLEQKLRERDDEILRLQKIISALTRKQGL